MAERETSSLVQYQWHPQPQAAALVAALVEDCCARSRQLANFRRQLREQTGTRLVDWLDHLVVPAEDSQAGELAAAGFQQDESGDERYATWRHDAGLFPAIRVGGEIRRLAIKVDSVDDFLSAVGRLMGETLPFKWPRPSAVRQIEAFTEAGVGLYGVERHGSRRFTAPPAEPRLLESAQDHMAAFRVRQRPLADTEAGFAEAHDRFAAAAADLGAEWACDLFFRAEREYWQSRNHAARGQYRRQQRLGLGWANHDHHTYRSSRACFVQLVTILERMGFVCRERFYAGREAGWGAQVLEQPDCGVVIFADVDLSPEEVTQDFAHEPLSDRDELGTVGLWCRLHGEAFLSAGMHHLEAQYDFDAVRQQLAEAGIETMAPFTDFPYLKQAFTTGEMWKVSPTQIEALRSEGRITDQQAEKFRSEGALGSHLEVLERNDGYKGFNQTGINDIIRRTDPRT